MGFIVGSMLVKLPKLLGKETYKSVFSWHIWGVFFQNEAYWPWFCCVAIWFKARE